MERINWSDGQWTHAPASAAEHGGALIVEAVESSDAWRETSYGFIHDTEHGLVTTFPQNSAMEVDFEGTFEGNFDQAGIFIRQDEEHWIKAAVEFSDGELQLGAVVTWPKSDWSVGVMEGWNGRPITIRVSRSGDAVTVRARSQDGPFRLVRVLPVPVDAELTAGPLVCAPSRAGLTVKFLEWRRDDADAQLH